MLKKMREIDAAKKAELERRSQLEAREEIREAEQRGKEKQLVKDVVSKLNPQSLLEQINREVLAGRGRVTQEEFMSDAGKYSERFFLNWGGGMEDTEDGYSCFGESIRITVGVDLPKHPSSVTYNGAATIHPKYAGIMILGGEYPRVETKPEKFFQADFELNMSNWNLDRLMPKLETALVEAFRKSHWSYSRTEGDID